jgi:peptidoglycan/LPS O-acetylase OafA/YrhL
MSISVICPPAANDPRLLFKKKKKKTTPVICLIALAFIASPVAFADHGVPLSHVTHTPLCVCVLPLLCCLSWLQPHAEGQSAQAATCRAQAVASGLK